MKTLCILFLALFLPKAYAITPIVAKDIKTPPEVISGQQTDFYEHHSTDKHFYEILAYYPQEEIDRFIASTTNKSVLKPLILCESENNNVARTDSNGLVSWGILQFNGTSTWDEYAPLAGVLSSTPMNPTSAIQTADWMISHGLLYKWGCAHKLGLVK